MPSAKDGLVKAFLVIIFGALFSLLISEFLISALGEGGKILAVLVNAFTILVGLSELDKANYWSIPYTAAYFVGLLLLGPYFIVGWELILYAVVILFYFLKKSLRKIGVRTIKL